MEIKVWILTGLIAILSIVLGFLLRTGIKGVYTRLDQLIRQNNSFGKALIRQAGDINALKDRVTTNEKRLNSHSDRIKDIEIEQAKSG